METMKIKKEPGGGYSTEFTISVVVRAIWDENGKRVTETFSWNGDYPPSKLTRNQMEQETD